MSNTLTTNWIKLRRLVGLPTATKDHEGQIRYDRADGATGHLYVARGLDDDTTFEWLTLSQRTAYTVSLPPFYIPDLPGTATTEAKLIFFNTSSASDIGTTRRIEMKRAGVVVGMILTSDDGRATGTATAQVLVNATGTAFDGGSVVLDVTDIASNSSFVSPADGVPFGAGDTLGAEVVTSGWTPITANVVVTLIVSLTAFD